MRNRSPRRHTILLVTRILLGAQGVLWIVLTAILVFRRVGASAASAPVVVPLLMAMNAAVFLGASLVLPRLGRVPVLLLAAFIVANTILSVTDQVGTLDVLVLAVDIATLVLLLILHRRRA
jgi:hypothetical protein